MADGACSVAGCTNTVANDRASVRFFRFPKKKEIRDAWEKCLRPGTWDLEKCLVCSIHFEESDYNRDLRMNIDGPDSGLRLKKNAVPSQHLDGVTSMNVVYGNSALVSRTNMITIINRQQKMDLASQPETDPLALNEDVFQSEEVEDSSYTEHKINLEDLVGPQSASQFGQSDSDPLDISDVRLNNAGCTKQENLKNAVVITEARETSSQIDQEEPNKWQQADGEAANARSECQAEVSSHPDVPCLISDLIHKRPFCFLNLDQQIQVVLAGKQIPHEMSRNKIPRRLSILRGNKLTPEKLWWMIFSPELKRTFCWPCILFGAEASPWNKEGMVTPVLVEILKHETSRLHVRSTLQYAMFVKNNGEGAQDAQESRQKISLQNSDVQKNREILRRLIDAACILPKIELPNNNQGDNGLSLVQKAYLDIVDAFSEYDVLLKLHLQKSGADKLTSPAIRNDLIRSIESVMLNAIKQEVKSAKFVSIICGEAADYSETMCEALYTSIVLRYVGVDGTVCERFIRYYKNKNCALYAQKMCMHIQNVITEFELADKFVSLSNDGRLDLLQATKAYSSLQSVIYIHSFRKSFNLVLKQDCSKIDKCRLFFAMLSRLAKFFSKSSKQRIEFESFLCTVNLNLESNLEETVFLLLPDFLKFFQTIIENPENWDEDTVVSAMGFKTFFQSLPNMFFLYLFATLFNHTNTLYKIPDHVIFTDYISCAAQVRVVRTKIRSVRENFNLFWKDVQIKEAECITTIKPPRSKKKSGQAPQSYQPLFSEIIDLVHVRTSEIFASIEKFNFFQLLDYRNFGGNAPSDERLKLLEETYPNHFDIKKLSNELIILYGIEELKFKLPYKYIAHFDTLKDAHQFVEVHKLVCLYLTIPYTQVSSDPSFSSLNRMKSVQEKLGHHPSSNLALMAIESTLLSQLRDLPSFYENVMKEFDKQEERDGFTFENVMESQDSTPVSRTL